MLPLGDGGTELDFDDPCGNGKSLLRLYPLLAAATDDSKLVGLIILLAKDG